MGSETGVNPPTYVLYGGIKIKVRLLLLSLLNTHTNEINPQIKNCGSFSAEFSEQKKNLLKAIIIFVDII